jgi:hypothetical protein
VSPPNLINDLLSRMIFSLFRKILSARYILIAAASISTISCFSLLADADPVTTENYPNVTLLSVYRTGSNQVVVSGLVARQQYSLKALNFSGSRISRSVTANACGEIIVNSAAKISSLSIGSELIDMMNLPVRDRIRCMVQR